METSSQDQKLDSRFEGAGMEFHAKYLGAVSVTQTKGQDVCQESMQKLLTQLKGRKSPKARLSIHLSFEGIQIRELPPGVEIDFHFRHSEVSYVWKDPRDYRSVGIIRSMQNPDKPDENVSKFYGFRTIKPAMPFLQEMQELFKLVKERMAERKQALTNEISKEKANVEENKETETTDVANSELGIKNMTLIEETQRTESDPFNLKLQFDDNSNKPTMKSAASLNSLDDLNDIFSQPAEALPTLEIPPVTSSVSFEPWKSPSPGVQQSLPTTSSSNQASSLFGQNLTSQESSKPAAYNPFQSGFQSQQPAPNTQNPFQQQPSMPSQYPVSHSNYAPPVVSGGYGQQAGYPSMPHQAPTYGSGGTQYTHNPFGSNMGNTSMQYQPHQGIPQQPTPQLAPSNTNPFGGFVSIFDQDSQVPAHAPLAPQQLNAPKPSDGKAKASDMKLFQDIAPDFGKFGIKKEGKGVGDQDSKKQRQTLSQLAAGSPKANLL